MSERVDVAELQRRSKDEQHIRAVLDDLRAQRDAVQIAAKAREGAAALARQEALLALRMTTAMMA